MPQDNSPTTKRAQLSWGTTILNMEDKQRMVCIPALYVIRLLFFFEKQVREDRLSLYGEKGAEFLGVFSKKV